MDQLQYSQAMSRLADLIAAVKQSHPSGQFSVASKHLVDEFSSLGYTLQVTATNQSKLLLPVNLKRKFLFMLNDDALGYARCAFGAAATLTVGLKLAAGGGGFLLDNNVPRGPLYIIGSIANNANITLIEA